MNLDESLGGSSCNGQENGDRYNGSEHRSERPLKKARFAWQVKGKYHLKNEDNDPAKISGTECTAPETAGPSGGVSNSSNDGSTEQDIKAIGGYLLNKNYDAFYSEDDDPDKYGFKPSNRNLSHRDNSKSNIFTPSTTLPQDIIKHSRNLISQDNTESKILKPIDAQIGSSQVPPLSRFIFPTDDSSDELEFVPVSMVLNYTEEQIIARWQARQMAKGPIDNTINGILDYMKENPLDEGDATLEAFDVADVINNRPGDRENSIENEGILMAISAHGLQNTSSSSSSFNSIYCESFQSSMSLNFREIFLPRIQSPALSICLSPIHSEDETNEEIQGEFGYALDKVQWPYSDELKNEDKVTIETPTFHSTPSLIFQNLYENLHNTDAASSNDVAIEKNHSDFLDAAVSYAIQSKGLTTFGTDYG